MSKKVMRIELHEGFFIPGLLSDAGGGQFGKSLPPSGKTLVGLEMTLQDNGSVDVEFGPKDRRVGINIGAANVKYAQYTPGQK